MAYGRGMMHRQRGLPYGGSLGAVFPALNEVGDVHYVQTRYLNPGNGPKYDNPAASLGSNPPYGSDGDEVVEGTAVVECVVHGRSRPERRSRRFG
jgi:hypothetical protein